MRQDLNLRPLRPERPASLSIEKHQNVESGVKARKFNILFLGKRKKKVTIKKFEE